VGGLTGGGPTLDRKLASQHTHTLSQGDYMLALVAQALPGMEARGMTLAEGTAVTSALLSVIAVGIWVRSRNDKRE